MFHNESNVTMRFKCRLSYIFRRFRNVKRTLRLSEDLKKRGVTKNLPPCCEGRDKGGTILAPPCFSDLIEILCKLCREEFQGKNAALRHKTPEVFTICYWQEKEGVHVMWVVYRFFVALYFLASFLYTLLPLGREVTEEQARKYFIFLTNWTYLLETILFILGFVIVAIKKHSEKKSREVMTNLPWYYKLYWILNTIVFPSAITVSLMFWTAVYDPVLFPANAINLIAHAINSLFVILDFILMAHPIKIMHFYWPLLYGFIYCAFSVIYELSGGTGVKGLIPIYRVLDWKYYPRRAILTSLIALSILTIFHFLFSLCSVLKTFSRDKQKESGQV